MITLSLEHTDGIERVAFRCAIRDKVIARRGESGLGSDALVERLAPWIEREFERLREAALKSLRSEGKLLQVEFGTTDQRR